MSKKPENNPNLFLEQSFRFLKKHRKLIMSSVLTEALPFYILAAFFRILTSYTFEVGTDLSFNIYRFSGLFSAFGTARLFAGVSALFALQKTNYSETIALKEFKSASKLVFRRNLPAYSIFAVLSFIGFLFSWFFGFAAFLLLLFFPPAAVFSENKTSEAFKKGMQTYTGSKFGENIGGALIYLVITGVLLGIFGGILALILSVTDYILPFALSINYEIRSILFGAVWLAAYAQIFLVAHRLFLIQNPVNNRMAEELISKKENFRKKSHKRNKDQRDRFLKFDQINYEEKRRKEEKKKEEKKKTDKKQSKKSSSKNKNSESWGFKDQPNRFNKDNDIKF